LEQLRRISEQARFVHQLSGLSSSLQTAASLLNLTRENARVYSLASRRLAELEKRTAYVLRSPGRPVR
jgi:hypothetical protein